MEKRIIRPKTDREKEWEKLPFCPYDPLELDRCHNDVFQPDEATCERCLSNRMTESLDDKNTAWAMQIFIAYRRFKQKGESKT